MSSISTNNSGITSDAWEVVPTVGMTGLFALKAPYSALIHEEIEYTVIGVTSIAGAIANGDDPLTDIYLLNGDTEASFKGDEASNHCIVTIQSGMGDVVTVPNSALIALPKADGIKYINVILGVSLSVVPDHLDLTTTKTEVSDLIYNQLGVRSTVFLTTVGGSVVITHAEHAAVEAARLVNIKSHLSIRSQNELLKLENTKLKERLMLLENYVKLKLV